MQPFTTLRNKIQQPSFMIKYLKMRYRTPDLF